MVGNVELTAPLSQKIAINLSESNIIDSGYNYGEQFDIVYSKHLRGLYTAEGSYINGFTTNYFFNSPRWHDQCRNSNSNFQPSTGVLTLNTTTGSIDTTQSVEIIKSRFSLSTQANGGGDVIPGSTAISSLTLSTNSVLITLNDAALTAYDNENLHLNYLDPTGDQLLMQTEYFKAVAVLILLPSRNPLTTAQRAQSDILRSDFQPSTGVLTIATTTDPSTPPSRPKASKSALFFNRSEWRWHCHPRLDCNQISDTQRQSR